MSWYKRAKVYGLNLPPEMMQNGKSVSIGQKEIENVLIVPENKETHFSDFYKSRPAYSDPRMKAPYEGWNGFSVAVKTQSGNWETQKWFPEYKNAEQWVIKTYGNV